MFTHFNGQLRLVEPQRASKVGYLFPQWLQFARLNRELVQLCNQMVQYIRVCTRLLSVLMPVTISLQCYLLYAILFTPIPVLFELVFALAIMELNVLLFVTIRQCSRVAANNVAFERINYQVYHNLQRNYGHLIVKYPRIFFKVGEQVITFIFYFTNLPCFCYDLSFYY